MKRALLFAALTLASHSAALAHYLWIAVESESGEQGTAHLYFEEGPAPGDGFYLDPFEKHGKMWVRLIGEDKRRDLKMTVSTKPNQKWLSAPLTAPAPRSVESYGKYGVYAYGKTNVLLHYYARFLDVKSHGELHELARTDELELQIVPHDAENEMQLTVYWKGKRAANAPVVIRGPKSFRKNLKTDEAGNVRFPVEKQGRYTCRTYVELKESGKDGGKDYELIRHHSSLTIDLPLAGP